jgi:hypothetical protein
MADADARAARLRSMRAAISRFVSTFFLHEGMNLCLMYFYTVVLLTGPRHTVLFLHQYSGERFRQLHEAEVLKADGYIVGLCFKNSGEMAEPRERHAPT